MQILIAAITWAFSCYLAAQGVQGPKYTQLLAGELQLSNNMVALDYGDANYQGQLDTLPYVGGAAQIILQSGRFGYGW